MASSVSPLDYEHITLRFRSYLERSENRIAAMVCKQWNEIFQPAVWASHFFNNDFNAPEAYKAALRKNAASIRTIRLRNCNSPNKILDLFASCTRLDALYCDLKFELPKDVTPALDLVDNNPCMQTFEIKGIPIKRMGIMARLVQVISEHPGLKRVKYYSNDRKIAEHMFFDTTLAGYEKTVLIPFLRHCLQLRKLQPSTEIPESAAKALFHVIQDYCPKLNELRVKYQPLESVISSLILGCHWLNIVTMDHGCTMGPAVMTALTSHSKFLTELTIESGTHIASTTSQQVLSTCGALRDASFLEVDEEKFVNVLEIKDMVSSEWACQESLESLDVYVGLDYGE
ncbi:hypothetical protein BGZ74_006562 [Mortierella antarctica]|nr:hypothetical protein BGZ74_006562 [Mortierella antarctica]